MSDIAALDAALARAEETEPGRSIIAACRLSYADGYQQALAEAREAVAAVVDGRGGYHPATAIAAIDALRTRGTNGESGRECVDKGMSQLLAVDFADTGTPPAGTGGVQPSTPTRQEGGAMSVPNPGNPQRAHRYSEQSDDNHEIGKDDDGDYVTYADHVAAVTAAENFAYERGVKAGYTSREDAVAVVDILRDALAAIDALTTSGKEG